jgi:hypothetical protein
MVIDITNPQNPQHTGSANTPGEARGVALLGTHAYVADAYSLQVIDIANPQSPVIVGSVGTPGSGLPGLNGACGVAVSGNHAYVADISGLQVIDITTPTNPVIIGSVDLPGLARGVAVSATHAYVADGAAGLQVLHAQCSATTPVFLTSFTISSTDGVVEIRWTIQSGEIDGEFRLGAWRGDARWDVALDTQQGPDFVAFDRSPEVAEGGDVLYRLLYRDPGQGWLVLAEQSLALGTALGVRLLGPYPNPANARVVIPFSAGRAGRARLTVHDVAGREVARVFEGALRRGAGQWIWSVEDAPGVTLPAGVYVVRLATEHGVQARKVVLVE